jgi:urease accessory protein
VTGAALVGGFALFHGAAHGNELASTAALAGMLLASVLLHALGLGLGGLLRKRREGARTGAPAWLPGLAGGSVAAFGAVLLLPL